MKRVDKNARAWEHLQYLCCELTTRTVGTRGSQQAADYAAAVMERAGFAVIRQSFDCINWQSKGARLLVKDQETYAISPSPYTLGCRTTAELVAVSTRAELAAVCAAGRILLLQGELAREPLMPKQFPFYNPTEHQELVALLEAKAPLAVLTASERSPETAGAVYPFPVIEDGDFEIPSAYMSAEEGRRLARHVGRTVDLAIDVVRIPARGWNAVGRRGPAERRVVVMAHVDAKQDTPGALDNAAGVTVLLLLAELLAEHAGPLGVELVALNGEDYYSNPGEQLYLEQNAGRFREIVLGINVDGLGYREGSSAYSLYNCSDALGRTIRRVLGRHQGLVEGPAWYQGDHGLFLMHDRPALALTSEALETIMTAIVHTPQDQLAVLQVEKLVAAAEALAELPQAIAD